MKSTDYRLWKRALLLGCMTVAVCLAGINQSAQSNQSRTGYVNDFAGVVDEHTRTRCSTILENVKQKTGIDFAIVTVQSTSGKDISDFLRRLAQEWNMGARNSKKSLLLVIAVDEKDSLAQFSRSAQLSLPEGVLAEMHHGMRSLINEGKFNEGLNAGINAFVSSLAGHMAMSPSEFEVAPTTAVTTPVVESTPTPEITSTPEVAPASLRRNRTVTASTVVRPTPEPSPASSLVATGDAEEAEEVELTLTKPLTERIALLETFLQQRPDSKSRMRATELLVSAHAALGDQKLRSRDSAGGVQEMMTAISLAPESSSDKLYTGVISQIPLNLFFRGEREAASKAAQEIEAKFGTDAKRLLGIAGFYITTEQGSEAVRVATRAVKLAPDSADSHQALGLALHISLRLEEAIAEYKRALELDPNSKGARRALADLQRAYGRSEEAANLYRAQLLADAGDKSARAGLVLALLDLGKTEEAKTELDAALTEDPRNLALLAGTAYWYAAHNQPEKALDFGNKGFEVEPRYPWLQVAIGRALLMQGKPLEAERSIRFAQQHGKFPTLDYELASTLVGAGLYEEAGNVLARSFTLKDGELETLLAGRVPSRGKTFNELLALERRASIFQSVAPDTEANEKLLKDLLAFTIAVNSDNPNSKQLVSLGKQFAAGDDAARVHRQLYVATRLLEKGIGNDAVLELAEAARGAADAGLSVPALTVAVQADEYRDLRANAIAQGATPDIPEAPRNVLSNILRGRIEDVAGWALLNKDQLDEAVEHFQRAVNILPAGTPLSRNSLWRLGAALERQGKKDDALTNYIRSYNSGNPDSVRRSVIERLYRSINGSLTGLDERLNGGTATASAEPAVTPAPVASESPSSSTPAVAEPSPTPETVVTTPTPEPSPEPVPTPTPENSPTPESSPTPETKPADPSSLSASPVEKMDASPPTVVVIRGRVLDKQNNPLTNVVVVLISPQGTVLASTTDSEGNYQFTVARSTHSYRLIPSKDGFSFEPIDRQLINASEDQKELNFVAVAKAP